MTANNAMYDMSSHETSVFEYFVRFNKYWFRWVKLTIYRQYLFEPMELDWLLKLRNICVLK